jgi:hypothetical protein
MSKENQNYDNESQGEEVEEDNGGGGTGIFQAFFFLLFGGTFAYKGFAQKYRDLHGPDAPVPPPLAALQMVLTHRGIPGPDATEMGVRVVNVTLPSGPVQVGDILQLVADRTGELVEIQVPPGAGPGSVLQVEIPDTAAPSMEQIGRPDDPDFAQGGALARSNTASSQLRRASTQSEHVMSALSGQTDLTEVEWYWLKVIVACTLWLAALTSVLIFAGRGTRKVKA